ncbi:MAG: hypothetical protein QXX79_05540 [Candidatus Bathyarchaeia archaeon]
MILTLGHSHEAEEYRSHLQAPKRSGEVSDIEWCPYFAPVNQTCTIAKIVNEKREMLVAWQVRS